jgi:sugar-specific transcriptional regulator TrmB
MKVCKLSLERVLKALWGLGLSQNDAQIYIYLATSGPQKAKDIINALTINKRQVYRSLKHLRNKGITMINDERPFLFSAVPFEDVLNLLMEIKKDQAKALQASKEELISDFRTKEKDPMPTIDYN